MFTRIAFDTRQYNPLLKILDSLSNEFEAVWKDDPTLIADKARKDDNLKKNIKAMRPLILAGATAVTVGIIASYEWREFTIMNVAWEAMSAIVASKTLGDAIEGTYEIVTSDKNTVTDRKRKTSKILGYDALCVIALVAWDWRKRTTGLIGLEGSLIVYLCGNSYQALNSLACKVFGACGGGIASLGRWLTPEQFGFVVNEPHSEEESQKQAITENVTKKWQGRCQIAGRVLIGIATFGSTQSIAATAAVQLSISTFQNLSKWFQLRLQV